MPWFIYCDAMWKVKTHLIDTKYVTALGSMLEKKYGSQLDLERSKEEDEVFFEPGGFGGYYLNQPRQQFVVAEKRLLLDCGKVEELFEKLLRAKKEILSLKESSLKIYKVYSRFKLLVLSSRE